MVEAYTDYNYLLYDLKSIFMEAIEVAPVPEVLSAFTKEMS
jgi:hypothetical protein